MHTLITVYIKLHIPVDRQAGFLPHGGNICEIALWSTLEMSVFIVRGVQDALLTAAVVRSFVSSVASAAQKLWAGCHCEGHARASYGDLAQPAIYRAA